MSQHEAFTFVLFPLRACNLLLHGIPGDDFQNAWPGAHPSGQGALPAHQDIAPRQIVRPGQLRRGQPDAGPMERRAHPQGAMQEDMRHEALGIEGPQGAIQQLERGLGSTHAHPRTVRRRLLQQAAQVANRLFDARVEIN